jgi:uncharacterized protein DUF4350
MGGGRGMNDSPFGRRRAGLLAAAAAASFGVFLALTLFSPDLEPLPAAQADSYSRSAIGHHAFVELLRRLDVPVLVSRHASAARAGTTALLVALDPPEPSGSAAKGLRKFIGDADAVLVALPKWTGRADRFGPDRLASAELLPLSAVESVLKDTGIPAHLVRPAATPDAASWTSTLGAAPDLRTPQLLESHSLEPLVACPAGILVGRWQDEEKDSSVYVLSDPDVLSNHGLNRGENASLVAALVDLARDHDRPVVVDETLHGHESAPGLGRELLGFPVALVAVQALVCLAALLWAAACRFGAPVPVAPPLRRGSSHLIENTALLLRHAGHSPLVLARYLRDTLRAVALAVHVPTDLSPADLRLTLGRIGRARGTEEDLDALDERVRNAADQKAGWEHQAVRTAQDIHRWRQEILHGSGKHTGSDSGPP